MRKWKNYQSDSIGPYFFFSLQKIILETGFRARFFKRILLGLSQIWKWGAALRNWAYDRNLFRTNALPLQVISIGNISMGGTGKTPTVLFLCEQLKEENIFPSILSRGYRSKFESDEGVFCNQDGPLFSWREMGDEPYMLATRLPKNPIWVGKNRVHTAKFALEKGAKLCILDDGLQYRKLKRDFELINIQSQDLFRNLHFFPRGNLRDSLGRLQDADLVLIQNVQDEKHFQECRDQARLYSNSPVVGMNYQVDAILDVNRNSVLTLKDTPVAIFCSIGQPEIFCETAKSLGAEIKNQMLGMDHSGFSEDLLYQFSIDSQKKGAKYLLCTEKDWVKLPKNNKVILPVLFLKMKLKIVSGKDQWKIFIEKISNKVNNEAV